MPITYIMLPIYIVANYYYTFIPCTYKTRLPLLFSQLLIPTDDYCFIFFFHRPTRKYPDPDEFDLCTALVVTRGYKKLCLFLITRRSPFLFSHPPLRLNDDCCFIFFFRKHFDLDEFELWVQ